MIIERLAYASPWRGVAPSAKAALMVFAMAAAWLAGTPGCALGVAAAMAVLTVAGARVPWRAYLRVARAPMGFLAVSCLGMLVTVSPSPGGPGWRLAPELWPQVLMVAARSLALCASLLWLVLTTPLADLLPLMRRLRLPDALVDLMAVAYRMQAVLGEAWADSLCAQHARCGHGSCRARWRSTAVLIAQMAVQVWMRAAALQAAADARNFDGRLRTLATQQPQQRREMALACAAGLALVLAVAMAGRRS